MKQRITEPRRHNGLRTIRRYWWYRARFREHDESQFGSPARFATVLPTTKELALKEIIFSSGSLVWLSLIEAQSSPKCRVSPSERTGLSWTRSGEESFRLSPRIFAACTTASVGPFSQVYVVVADRFRRSDARFLSLAHGDELRAPLQLLNRRRRVSPITFVSSHKSHDLDKNEVSSA